MPKFFERRQLVVPGDLIAEGDYIAGENVYRENNRIYAARIGLVEYQDNRVNVVALRAFYVPKVGDTVIGTVVEVGFSGWAVDINAPYLAMLRVSEVIKRPFKPQKDELTKILDVGDLILAKIIAYDRTQPPFLGVDEPGMGKITKGQIVKITPTKIPRVIGKKGSMISMLKQETGCHIILGQNGVILVTGKSPEDEELAIMAIRKIEEESHVSGLTDRIFQMIKMEKERRRLT
ncbi:MAG: exosome complex RNA-binding protein Rrp4 [Candidatus Bathyarchaeia archaeon]|nr:RNA-binding protein [Candidatus Bathyarchaeota archaeon]